MFDFKDRFNTRENCEYLAGLKWKQRYTCPKCGHRHHCKGHALMSRQCTSCRYVESPTAGTLFHGVKFDLVKAFNIVSTNKKGITSAELSRKLSLRLKTCWSFKLKAMKSSDTHLIEENAEVDETVICGTKKAHEAERVIRRNLWW